MIRSRARSLLLALAASALALVMVPAPASAAPAASALTLRLVDLPPGYGAPFGGCDDSPPLGNAKPLVRACKIELLRYWTPPGATPGPAVVTSIAIVFPSAQKAESALDDPLGAASLAFDDRPSDDFKVVAPAPEIGDEAVLLRASDGPVVIVWRSGTVLATLLADSGRRPVDLQTALALATAQQARIAAPTPLGSADNEGREVALDDPGLGLPVWWLGRELPRRGALPGLRYAGSFPGDLFGPRRQDIGPVLFYTRRGSRAEVVLQLARPSILHRPAMRRELRRMRQDRCILLRRVTLRDGRATIFQRSPRCPRLDVSKTPDALNDTTAIVVLPGLVAFVLADDCISCHGPVSRYESIAGMRRLVHALRLREPQDVALP